MMLSRIGWVRVAFYLMAVGLVILEASMLTASAEARRPAANIPSPKRDDPVARNQDISGKLCIAGQPIVLIRPDGAGTEWYVQPALEVNDKGFFKAKARFGNDKTAMGSKFQITVVVARTKEESEFFKDKEALPNLPDVFARSEVVPVVLGDKPAEKDKPEPKVAAVASGMIVSPAMNGGVEQVGEVTGKVNPKAWPVVVVRADDPNEPWWVQGPADVNKEGEFNCIARFGNEKTPGGTKFRLMVLTLASNEAASALAVGSSFLKIPADVTRSEEILVVRGKVE